MDYSKLRVLRLSSERLREQRNTVRNLSEKLYIHESYMEVLNTVIRAHSSKGYSEDIDMALSKELEDIAIKEEIDIELKRGVPSPKPPQL